MIAEVAITLASQSMRFIGRLPQPMGLWHASQEANARGDTCGDPPGVLLAEEHRITQFFQIVPSEASLRHWHQDELPFPASRLSNAKTFTLACTRAPDYLS